MKSLYLKYIEVKVYEIYVKKCLLYLSCGSSELLKFKEMDIKSIGIFTKIKHSVDY